MSVLKSRWGISGGTIEADGLATAECPGQRRCIIDVGGSPGGVFTVRNRRAICVPSHEDDVVSGR
jgi:hypothetical protein